MGRRDAGGRADGGELPVISNASPLIALERIGSLGLLSELYGELVMPPAVTRELGPPWPQPWTRLRTPRLPFDRRVATARLDPSELEAIALALEIGDDVILLDDRAARRLGRALDLPVSGTIGVLQSAKRIGLLPGIGPTLDAVLARGFRASSQGIAQALVDSGEAASTRRS